MSDDKPSFHIDSDWKKQAQEEKRKLAEQDAARKAQAPPPAAAPAPGRAASPEEAPEASFAAIIQDLATPVMMYLGQVNMRGMEPVLNMDMARYHLDQLAVLEQKTKGNLDPAEQQTLDLALHECRSRFVQIAARVAELV